MSEPSQSPRVPKSMHRERVKIRQRLWVLLVMHAVLPLEDLRPLLIDDPQKPDLLLLEVDESLYERWREAIVEQCGAEWEARPIQSDLTTIDSSLTGISLVVGRRRLVSRFFESIALDDEEIEESEVAALAKYKLALDIINGTYPNLPNPSDVPRFREEGFLDPFGQNTGFLEVAWSRIGTIVGRITSKAHAQAIATTLPASFDEYVNLPIQSWQTFVSSAPSAEDTTPFQTIRLLPIPPHDKDEATTGLNLLQRCLLATTALNAIETDDELWTELFETIEHLGYILVSHSIDMKDLPKDPPLGDCFTIGAEIAKMHSLNMMHGDLHPANLRINPPGIMDFGKSCMFNRPLTTVERAMDLALFKLNFGFLIWEAFKLGYRTSAPKEAEEVFQLI